MKIFSEATRHESDASNSPYFQGQPKTAEVNKGEILKNIIRPVEILRPYSPLTISINTQGESIQLCVNYCF
jgi:hypothetical protein